MDVVVDPTHRNLGLETDMANPNFAGARNPDDLLWVQFSIKPIQNNFKSQKENRPIFEDQLWIEIRIPGNQHTIIERPANDQDKYRFPRQWAYWERTHGADGQNVGTPLTQWPMLRPSQVEELRAYKFYTVDQVAFASDEQVSRIGKAAGMAPFSFRERAKLFLESAKDNALAVKQAEDIKERDAKIEKMEAEMKELREMVMAQAKANVQAQPPHRAATR
jgi:hypothetical protein